MPNGIHIIAFCDLDVLRHAAVSLVCASLVLLGLCLFNPPGSHVLGAVVNLCSICLPVLSLAVRTGARIYRDYTRPDRSAGCEVA